MPCQETAPEPSLLLLIFCFPAVVVRVAAGGEVADARAAAVARCAEARAAAVARCSEAGAATVARCLFPGDDRR